jgi:glycosyltransferase involved in cell wall biosynthesis/GT2 family glycosyltransferase
VRVLLVHHAYPPAATGGSEIYTEALARRLARDHEVAVLHRSADPLRPDHDLRRSSQDGVRLYSLNNLHRDVPGFEAYRDPLAAAAATRVLDEVRPEVVHVGHLAGLSTGIVFEARRRGLAVVITLHDFWPVCPLGQLLNVELQVCPGPTPRRCLGCVGAQVATTRPGAAAAGRAVPLGAAAGRLLARLGRSGEARVDDRIREMRAVLRAADVLVSPSAFLRDRMAALGVDGMQVLPNGHEPLATAAPSRRDPPGPVRFGFVGSAIPSKGVHVLARAFRLLDDPRASLAIHGPFPAYHGDTGYEARVRAILGPAADGIVKGGFAPAGLPRVLGALDVLVVPSIWEENAPLTVQEAFLAGLPVVASDHGGLREMVRAGEDGLLFPPGDADGLARVMRRLLDEPDLLGRLGRRPRPVPTMDGHVEALLPLYRDAVSRARARGGSVGVIVLDRGRPEDARGAVRSAMDADVAPRIVVVQNGPGPEVDLPDGVALVRLPENRGYAAGMNAGAAALRAAGCDRFLLLNNDARLEPGALRLLAEALDDVRLGAVGPVILRAADGRVESRGGDVDLSRGRSRLLGHGEEAPRGRGLREVDMLSGAAWMVSEAALARVGALDESFFHSFEDTDWCVRARRAGLGLAVVLGARATHEGGATLGPSSPDRLYYATRSQLRGVEKLEPRRGWRSSWRRAVMLARSLAHAARQAEVGRADAVRAVLAAFSDFRRGYAGPRPPAP